MTPAELIRRGMSQLKKKESHSEVKVFVNKTLEISKFPGGHFPGAVTSFQTVQ